jgi:hypothetical protein
MYGRGCGGACSCHDFFYDEVITARNSPFNPKIIALLNSYYKDLRDAGIDVACPVDDQCSGDDFKRLSHIMWMITKMLMEYNSNTWSIRKVNRWLGFIQGTLWCMDQRGILAMRDESRNLYDSSDEPKKYPGCWKPNKDKK